jgi:hypothetical protein
MNENINLCEILKDCPMGTPFWSPILGGVKFMDIDESFVTVEDKFGSSWDINSDSTLTISKNKSEEPMLYPSREQRDWSKWQCPKPKFDPKTLQPFDKVLARINDRRWYADFISIAAGDNVSAICTMSGMGFHKIIPYNDDTKHLVGTSDEAPEYYRYWEE